jgi:YD repeat-containing protein
LVLSDPRGLAVRRIDYYRSQAGTAAEPRINAQWHDHAGRPTDQWDARQFAHFQAGTRTTPNQHTVYSLTGNVVLEHNVNSASRTNLYDVAGRPADNWNAKGTVRQYRYDDCARPVAILQSGSDGSMRTTQRLSYGPADAASAARNQCGRICRHDDDSGTLLFDSYTLRGETSAQRQRFLSDLAASDWPAEIVARDALLEPGDGYLSLSQFDASGAPLSMTDAKGNRQTPSYDITGQESARWRGRSRSWLCGQSVWRSGWRSCGYLGDG